MKSLWRMVLGMVLVSMVWATSAGAAKVTLNYWQGWLAPEHIETEKEIVADFMKLNPDIQVEFTHMTAPWEQLKVALAAGALGDVVVSSRDDFPDWQQSGMFKDLTPYLEREPGFLREFVPQLIQLFTVNGRVYGLPYSANGRGLFAYNADLMAQAGVPEPGTDVWSWTEFVENGKKLVRFDGENMTQAAFAVDRTPMAIWTWFWSRGTDLFDPAFTKHTLDGAAVETLNYLHSLVFESNIAARPGQSPSARVIISGVGPWSFVGWKNQYSQGGAQMKLMWQPAPDGKQRIAMLGGSGLQIGSTTKHPEEAWRLLRYLTSEEVQWKRFLTGYGTSSLLRNLARASQLTDSPIPAPQSIYWDAFKVGKTQPSFPKYRAWASIWNGYTAQLFAGNISVSAAVEQIERETAILLAQ